MAARSKARRRALDLLYESEAKTMSAGELLDQRITDGQPPHHPYTTDLVRGVVAHLARLDEILEQYSEGWTLSRMPALDRNVLRLGVFEVLYVDDVPDAVVMSEAAGLAAELSTDESPGFVNGVLGAVSRDKETLRTTALGG